LRFQLTFAAPIKPASGILVEVRTSSLPSMSPAMPFSKAQVELVADLVERSGDAWSFEMALERALQLGRSGSAVLRSADDLFLALCRS
jgi:hypothetical protein